MGKEQKKSQIEIAGLKALRKLRKSTKDLLSSPAIADTDKAIILEKTASLVHDIFQASQHNIPFEEALHRKAQGLRKNSGDIFVHHPPETLGTPPDLSEVPQWRGRKQYGMPLDFIQAHYGQWLSAFGAEQDTIFQDQIRRHDKRLITAIENQLREEGQGRRVREFLKPRSARLDRELAHVTVEDLKQTPRLASTLYSRQKRAHEAKEVIAPSHPTTPTR